MESWPYWIWLAVMMLAEAALFLVPVNIVNNRPIKKRTVILPIIGAALMMGLLAAGAVFAITEFITQDPLYKQAGWMSLCALLLMWGLWAFIFSRWSKNLKPGDFIGRQCRALFGGSILELLIALPAHIIARNRDYCCAGFSTFFGIIFGLSVMLFSFGPGVFFLYAQKIRAITDSSVKK